MAFDKDIPAASTSLRVSNPQILENQESSQEALNNEHIFTGTDAGTQTGDHTQGSARCFFAAAAPPVRIDTTNFIATDNGSLWINTGDNALSIMTDYSQAIAADKWTLVSDEVIAVLLAANRVFAGTLGVDGNFEVGTGSEFTVAAASGNISTNGSINPTSYLEANGGFLNSDTMAAASDTTTASSDSIAKFATLDAGGVLMHDAEGAFENADLSVNNGSSFTKTKIYTKYITGTLAAAASTNVPHSITNGATKIIAVSVLAFDDASRTLTNPDPIMYYISAQDVNIVFNNVASTVQGNAFTLRIDYIL